MKDRVSVPIFEGEGDVRQIFLKIAACLPVKLTREDKLPKKICDDCVYKVELFYQFWNTTANAEKQLLQWLGEVSLEDKQGYVTNVLNPSVMKQEQSTENRLDGNVMQQVEEHQNNMGMGMMDNMGLGIPMIISSANQQQITSVPMDTSSNSVQTIQAVPGPSSQTTHNQIPQNQTSSTQQEDEEESSEDEENSDEECDGDEGLPVKEESEEDPSNRTIEPTTFVNVSLACDEAGPSGLQQQKISDMPEMPIPQPTDGDPKSGTRRITSRAIHECVKCGACFCHTRKLVEHLKNLHNIDRAFSCDECGKTFRSPMNIARHKLIHTGSKRFACDLCDYRSNQKSNLESHRRRHTKDYSFRCGQCQKGFFLRTEYVEHVNVHTRKEMYRCDHCTKTYPYKKNLTHHVRTRHADILPAEMESGAKRKHVCSICLEAFTRKRFLETHLSQLHGLREKAGHLCDLCGAMLSSTRRLTVHRRRHVNEKVAKCDVCDKQFASKENLSVHRRVHTGEKPYGCSQCGRRFAQRTSLILHLRYHSGERPYRCVDCGKGFVSGSFLRKHRKTHEKTSSQLET